MKWEKHCVLHHLDYATLKDLKQYLNNYSRACKNLDIEPSNLNHQPGNCQPMKQQQSDSRPNQFTSMFKQNYDKSSGISARATTSTFPIDNQVHYVGKCPNFLKLPVDQRVELVNQHKLCFNCLGQHRLSECTSSTRCFNNNCGGKHHSTLHIDKKPFQTHNQKSNMQLGTTVTKPSDQAEEPIQKMNNIRNQLQFLPVTLFNNGIKLDCYTILDNCSSCSYILSKTAETLQCKPSQQLQLSVRGAFSKDKVSSSLVRLSIGPHNSTKPTFTLQSVYPFEALIFDAIDANNINKSCSLYNHLRHVNFPDLGDNTVQILLGVDAFWNFAERDIRKGPTGTPYAVKNLLGWTITGPLNQKSNSSGSNSHSTKFIDLNDQEDANLTN